MNDFTNADLSVSGGTLSTVTSSDGGVTWTATFTPTANITATSNLITLDNTGVTDAAGNSGTGTMNSNLYAIDTALPTATIVITDTTLKAGESTTVTITFSEAVNDFTNADLIANGGTLSTVTSSDGGVTWTATFTPTANITAAQNWITLNNTGVTDVAGNVGEGVIRSNTYALDTAPPPDPKLLLDQATSVNGHQVSPTGLVTISELEEGGSWQYSLDNGATWLTGLGNSVQLPGYGEHHLMVKQTDAAGNVSHVSILRGVVESLILPMLASTGVIQGMESAGSATSVFELLEVSSVHPDFLSFGSALFSPTYLPSGFGRANEIEGFGSQSDLIHPLNYFGDAQPSTSDMSRSVVGQAVSEIAVVSGQASTLQLTSVLEGMGEQWLASSIHFAFENAKDLPPWLRLDHQTGQLMVLAPKGLHTVLVLRIKVTDVQGHEVVRTIRLVVGDTRGASIVHSGRAGLSEKLSQVAQQQAGQRAALYFHG